MADDAPGSQELTLADDAATGKVSSAPSRSGQGEASAPEPLTAVQRWRNIAFLSVGWCVAVSVLFIQVSNTPGVVLRLTGSRGLATLSFGIMICMGAVACLPGAATMHRYGRRYTYLAGGLVALGGAVLQCFGMDSENEGLLIVGSVLQGPMYGLANSLRFASAEFALPHERPRALAALVAGALFSAVTGPELARRARDMIDGSPTTGAYVIACILYVVQIVSVCFLVQWHRVPRKKELPVGAPPEPAKPGQDPVRAPRPYAAVVTHCLTSVDFVLAMGAAAWAFGWMASLMGATPVLMSSNGRSRDDSTTVLEVHLISMFLPGFVSGRTVQKFGALNNLLFGFLVLAAGTGVYFVPDAEWMYFVALVLLGVGWNFAYVAASVLGTQYVARQKAAPRDVVMMQGLFDTGVLAVMSTGTMSVGYAIDGIGKDSTLGYFMAIGGVATIVALGLAVALWVRRPGTEAEAGAEGGAREKA
ncbi:unnamed protein product [Pedinophyceae sp. YPF-701]|nr:unnamed protein product [Pedinophyceae sp. YPF-701]